MPNSSIDPRPDARRRDITVLGLLGTGYFFSGFYGLALPPLFPLLKVEFEISYAALGVVMGTLSIASGVAQIPAGFLVDRVGARWVLIVGLAVLAGAIGLIGVSSSYAVLLCLVIIAGIGNSVFQPADYAILSSTFHRGRLGRAFSVHTFAGHLGLMSAPVTMVLLTGWYNWRAAVIIVGGFGLVGMLAMLLYRDLLHTDLSERTKLAPDSRAGTAPKDGVTSLLSAPIVLLWLFYVVASMASSGILTFSVTAMVALHQTSLASANVALTGFYFASALGVLIGGVIADRTGRHKLVVVAALVTGGAMIMLVGTLSLPVLSLVSALAIAGLMHGMTRPSRDLMVRTAVPRGSIGKVFGFMGTGHSIGGAVSPIFFGWMIDQGEPKGVFLVIALLMLLAVGTILAAKRPRYGVR